MEKTIKDAKSLHSITFYMPSNRIDFLNHVLKKVSKEIYGNDKRMISKYIRELIYTDLRKRGFLDEKNNPIEKREDEDV